MAKDRVSIEVVGENDDLLNTIDESVDKVNAIEDAIGDVPPVNVPIEIEDVGDITADIPAVNVPVEVEEPEPVEVPVEVVEPEPVEVEVNDPDPVVVEVPDPDPVVVEVPDPEPVVVEVIDPDPVVVEVPDPEPVTVETIDPDPLNVEVNMEGFEDLFANLEAMRERLGAAQEKLDSLKDSGGDLGSVLGGASTGGLLKMAGALGVVAGGAFAAGKAIVEGLIGAAYKAIEVGGQMISLAQEQAEAEQKLESVIRATGGAAGFTAEQLKQHAANLQNITTVGDETIIGVEALLATFRNVRGDVFLDATEAALDMAHVMGGDADSAAKMLGKALNDPVRGMLAMSEANITFSQSQQDVIRDMVETGDVAGAQRVILDELANQVGGAASDAAGTFEGKMDQLKNRIGDVGERIGGVLISALEKLMPVMEGAVTILETFAGWLETFGGNVDDASGKLADNATETSSWGDTLLGVLMASSTMIQEWETTWDMAVTSTALSLVSFGEDFKHLFTKVVPELLRWFADNWQKIFTDIGNYTNTVMENMGKNVIGFFKNTWDWMRGGGEDKFEFVALTEGFEATLDELPKIAERKKSELELSLEKDLADQAMKMLEAFNDNMDKAKSGVKDTDIGDDNADDVDPDQFKKKEKPKAEPKEKQDKTPEEKKEEAPDAKLEGLENLHDRIQQAAAGKRDHTEAMAKDELRNQLLGDMVKKIEDIMPAGFFDKELDLGALAGAGAEKVGEMIAQLPDLLTFDSDTLSGLRESLVGGLVDATERIEREKSKPKPEVNEPDPYAQVLGDIDDKMGDFVAIAQGVSRALPLRGTLG